MAELDCDNNNLSPEQYLRGTFGTDANGNCGLRIIEVDDANEALEDCDLSNISALALLKQLIDVDANGNLAIRVFQNSATDEQCIDCGNTFMDLEQIVSKSLVGKATDGRAALRLLS